MGEGYWAKRQRAGMGRRRFLQVAAGGSAGLTGLALLACSSSNNNNSTSKATVNSGAPSQAAGTQATARATAVAGTATRAATVAGQSSPAAQAPKRGGTYQDSLTGDPPNLDPFKTTSFLTNHWADGPYSRLFVVQGVPLSQFPVFQVDPDAAAAYETTDGINYTIKLRNNVRFHPPIDRLMTTDDVIASWQRFLGKAPGTTPSVYADQLALIDTLQAVDPSTLSLKLKYPHTYILLKLADSYFLVLYPKEVGTAFDPSQTMVGSGPWVMSSYQKGVEAKFARFSQWHLGPQLPNVDGIESHVIPEYATGLQQFLGGNLDAYTPTTSDDVLRVRSQIPGVHYVPQTNPYIGAISFSGKDPNSPWADPRVRQAVSMALDKDAIFEALYDAQKLTSSGLPVQVKQHNFIPVGMGKYWLDPKGSQIDPKVKPFYGYDPDGAKQLLSAAGFPNGFSANYHYSNIYGDRWSRCAQLLQQYLTKVGLKLNPVVEDVGVFTSKTNVGDFDGLAFVYYGTNDPIHVFEFMYSPSSTRNTSKVNDPQLNDMITAMQAERDDSKLVQKMYDAQNYLGTKFYYVPAVYDSGPTWNAFAPRVQEADQWLTVRTGGFSVGAVRRWLSS